MSLMQSVRQRVQRIARAPTLREQPSLDRMASHLHTGMPLKDLKWLVDALGTLDAVLLSMSEVFCVLKYSFVFLHQLPSKYAGRDLLEFRQQDLAALSEEMTTLVPRQSLIELKTERSLRVVMTKVAELDLRQIKNKFMALRRFCDEFCNEVDNPLATGPPVAELKGWS